jgi:hypothetical protein
MSAFEFMWNLGQQGEIDTQKEQIDELTRKVNLLYEWVQYLNKELEKVKNEKEV